METSLIAPAYWTTEHLDRVIIQGADSTTYLQSQLTQDIRALAVGDATWTFLLAPVGKIEAFGRLLRRGEQSYELEVDAGFGEVALERVNRFKIRVDVTARVEPAAVPQIAAELEAERIGRGWPRMGTEILPGETICAETGLVPITVSFTKGCYPGQELVERMDARGAVAPRSLRRLEVGAGTAVGDPICDAAGAEVGTVTSVAGVRALGFVKRSSTIGEVVNIEP